MNLRKQYGGSLAVLACLLIAAAALVLPSCGSDKPCSSNPTGPGCVASPTPPPPPAQVTRVVSQGSDTLESETLGAVVFTTTTSGTVGVEVNWTFATNDVDIYLTRGHDPCTEETFNNRSCGFIATEESPSLKPERLTVPNLAAGTYTLYVANFGDTDESVAWQVTLTSASASSTSSATTATVPRSAAKGTLNRILELR
jgi:hypothetical protein